MRIKCDTNYERSALNIEINHKIISFDFGDKIRK